jgi:uncharacterized membrane protein YjjP (DUF1212 family)
MVNENMEKCPFCNSIIDRQAAMAAAEVQDKANQSYSDANYTKTAAVAMWVFLGISFIPFIPLVAWGFVVTFFVVLIMLIRWQVKFGGLKTADPDYVKAKRSRNIAALLWLLAIPGLIVKALVEVLVTGS